MCEQGKTIDGIDSCIVTLVRTLNKGGFKTVASCCGHGNTPGNIALIDGKELIICPDFKTGRQIDKIFPDIHGKTKEKELYWSGGWVYG